MVDRPSARGGDSLESSPGAVAALFEPVVSAAFKPFFRFLGEFSALETKKLNRTLNELTFGGDGYGATCENLLKASKLCFAAANTALDRCVTLTGGVEAEAAVAALSEYLTEYVQRLFSLLRRIRKLAGLDTAAPAAAAGKDGSTSGSSGGRGTDLLSDSEDWSGFQGAFQLLRTARQIKNEMTAYAPVSPSTAIRCRARHALIILLCCCGVGLLCCVGMYRFDARASQVLGRSVQSLLSHATARSKSSDVGSGGGAPTLDQTISYIFLSRDATKTRWLQQFIDSSSSASASSTATDSKSKSTPSKPNTTTIIGAGSGSGSVVLLSQPNQLFDSLIGALKNLIFDTLFSPLRSQLVGLAELPVWGETPKALFGGLLAALPSFSQPSEYMTHAGERLLSLVQELENYLHAQAETERQQNAADSFGSSSGSGSGDVKSSPPTPLTSASAAAAAAAAAAAEENDTTYWLGVLASGVVKFVMDRITHIPKLTDKGAAQLATDIDYLANVMKAVGVPIPVITEHVRRALQTPPPATHWTAALIGSAQWGTPPCTDPDHRSLVLTIFAIRKTSHIPPAVPITAVKLNG